jgi:hypothetical protein
MIGYVDLVWVKEVSGSGVYEAPAWSVKEGDIASVHFSGMCGGVRECHVKAFVTLDKGSEEYRFIQFINGGPIEKVKALYHKCEVEE